MKKLFILLCFTATLFPQQYVWELKQAGSSLGNPIAVDSRDRKTIYYGSNSLIYRSTNAGESFVQYGTAIPSATKIKNILVSKKDASTMLVATKGSSSDQIVKTTDNGATWNVVANGLTFSYFGIPMTPDPKHPDTIYTMSGSSFMESRDFGSTWTTVSSPSNFGSPCDIEVFPDSSNIILVGDNTTGIFRSSDFGRTWQTVFTTSGEIPTIAIARKDGAACYATRWGGGGGVLRSSDYGKTWIPISYFNGQNMWGVDVSPDDPKVVITGKYSGNQIFISTDGGVNWKTTSIAGSNYSIFFINWQNIYAAQSTGFYKLRDIKGSKDRGFAAFTAKNNQKTISVQWQVKDAENAKLAEVLIAKNNGVFRAVRTIRYEAGATADNNVDVAEKGDIQVKVQVTYADGTLEESETVKIGNQAKATQLHSGAYPNPFNPSTKLQFTTTVSGSAEIIVFNAIGETVLRETQSVEQEGAHSFSLNLTGLPSGIYFYQLRFQSPGSKQLIENGKLLLQK